MTRIVVVDNHGQFTHLEHRTLRDMGVDTEIIDNTAPPAEIDADGLVLSGGPDIDDAGNCADYLELDVPVLGICLGMQVIADAAAESDVCGVEAMSDPDRDLYGVQWHPEVAHTAEGEEVFESFKTICE